MTRLRAVIRGSAVPAECCPACGQKLPPADPNELRFDGTLIYYKGQEIGAFKARNPTTRQSNLTYLGVNGRALFELLYVNIGRVVRMTQIDDLLWGDDPDGGPDGVTNLRRIYAARIRNVIAFHRLPFRLDTIDRVGYRLSREPQDDR